MSSNDENRLDGKVWVMKNSDKSVRPMDPSQAAVACRGASYRKLTAIEHGLIRGDPKYGYELADEPCPEGEMTILAPVDVPKGRWDRFKE